MKPGVEKCSWNGTKRLKNIQKFSKVPYAKVRQMIWRQFEKRVKTGPVHDKAKLSKDGPPEIHEEKNFKLSLDHNLKQKIFEAMFLISKLLF